MSLEAKVAELDHLSQVREQWTRASAELSEVRCELRNAQKTCEELQREVEDVKMLRSNLHHLQAQLDTGANEKLAAEAERDAARQEREDAFCALDTVQTSMREMEHVAALASKQHQGNTAIDCIVLDV